MSHRSFVLSVIGVVLTTALIFAIGPARWPLVTVAKVHRGELSATFLASGEVKAPLSVVVATGSGRVQRFAVQEQQEVLKGQVLLELENAAATQQLQDAQAAFWTAQADLNARRERLGLTREQLGEAARQAAHEEARLRKLQTERRAAARAAVREASLKIDERGAELQVRRAERKRLQELAAQGVVAQRELDLAGLAEAGAYARLREARVHHEQVRRREQLAAAEAENELARRAEGRRLAELARQETLPLESEVEGSRLGVLVRSQALAASRFAVRSRSVFAPVAGTVWRCLVTEGDMVREGQPLVRILGAGERRVEAWVGEQDAALVQVGLKVQVRTGSHGLWEGTVVRVDPALEHPPETAGAGRYLRFEVQLAQSEGPRPGSPVEVEGRSVLARGTAIVPAAALFERAGKSWVAVVEGGRVRLRSVKRGAAAAEGVALVEGPAPGQLVVIEAPMGLEEGQFVRVRGTGSI